MGVVFFWWGYTFYGDSIFLWGYILLIGVMFFGGDILFYILREG